MTSETQMELTKRRYDARCKEFRQVLEYFTFKGVCVTRAICIRLRQVIRLSSKPGILGMCHYNEPLI